MSMNFFVVAQEQHRPRSAQAHPAGRGWGEAWGAGRLGSAEPGGGEGGDPAVRRLWRIARASLRRKDNLERQLRRGWPGPRPRSRPGAGWTLDSPSAVHFFRGAPRERSAPAERSRSLGWRDRPRCRNGDDRCNDHGKIQSQPGDNRQNSLQSSRWPQPAFLGQGEIALRS